MELLFVTPYVPNLIRVRDFQFIRHLVARGNRLTLATLWNSPEEHADLETLQRDLAIEVLSAHLPRNRSLMNCLLAVPSRLPLQAAWCRQPDLLEQLSTHLTQHRVDAVHVAHLRGSQFGLHAQQLRDGLESRPPVVWDSVDSISMLFDQASQHSNSLKTRLSTRLDLSRTRRYEGRLVNTFDHTVVTAQGDAQALHELAMAQAGEVAAREPRISVVPNGVDLEMFRPDPDSERAPARIIYSGKMSYHANEAAALALVQEIMPIVWQKMPGAEVWIVGKDPTAKVLALNSSGATERRVVVTGAVPNVATYLQRATVAAAPVPYGAGVQNKVLEAMACATPVVASTRAASALKVTADCDLIVAVDTPAFAAGLLRLLDSPELRRSVGQAGRTYVERNHSWDSAAAQLEQIYRGAGAAPSQV